MGSWCTGCWLKQDKESSCHSPWDEKQFFPTPQPLCRSHEGLFPRCLAMKTPAVGYASGPRKHETVWTSEEVMSSRQVPRWTWHARHRCSLNTRSQISPGLGSQGNGVERPVPGLEEEETQQTQLTFPKQL